MVLLIVGAVGFLWSQPERLAPLARLDGPRLTALTVVMLVFFYTTGWTFALLVRLVDVRLSQVEATGLSFLTNFINYLGPVRPGAAAKAVYLKLVHGLPLSVFGAVLAANALLVMAVTGASGLGLLVVAWLVRGMASVELALAAGGVMAAGLLPLAVRLPVSTRVGRLDAIYQQTRAGYNRIRRQRRGILLVVLSLLAQFLLSTLIMYLAFDALGVPIDLLSAAIIGVFTGIANFFTLTPNNLGVQEYVMAYLYALSGAGFADGLLGAALVRAVHMALTLFVTPLLLIPILNKAGLSWNALTKSAPSEAA